MDYPENDAEFVEKTITRVEKQGESYAITTDDGWSLWCGDNCPIEPKVGHVTRQYGKGIGYTVRGLFIDGAEFWYRDAAGEKRHREDELYGADIAEWLRRWDADKSVWSISMGGFGPGYEQAIQITVAEIVRWLVANTPAEGDEWWAYKGDMERTVLARVRPLGLSGAQWGAAVNLAGKLYTLGPKAVMADPAVSDRHIQVSRTFPSLVAENA